MQRLAERVGLPSRDAVVVVGSISGSQFINHAFLVLLPPILPLLSETFDVSIAQLGLVLGAQALVNTAFQLPFGYLADHYDRTIALGMSSVLGAAGALVTALAPDFPTLVAGQVVLGLGVAGHHPSHYPLLADASPETARGRVFAMYNFGGSLGFATPPVLITAVIAVPGLTWRHAVGLIGGVGLAYGVLITAVIAWRVSDDVSAPNTDTDASQARLADRIRAELRRLAANPAILVLAVLALCASTASWGVTSYAVVFLTDVYTLSLGVANLALTGLYVVGAGAILLGGYLTDRVGGEGVLLASFGSATILIGVIAAGVVPAMAAVALFLLLGGVRSLAGPARDELTERVAGQGSVAQSFAIVTIGIMLGSTVAPPVFGYLIEWTGVQVAFATIAGVALVATVLTVFVIVTISPQAREQATAGD